jgi:hypothetical protein
MKASLEDPDTEIIVTDDVRRDFFGDLLRIKDHQVVKTLSSGPSSRVYLAGTCNQDLSLSSRNSKNLNIKYNKYQNQELYVIKKIPITSAKHVSDSWRDSDVECSNCDEDDPMPELESMFNEIFVLRRAHHDNIIQLREVVVESEAPNDIFLGSFVKIFSV